MLIMNYDSARTKIQSQSRHLCHAIMDNIVFFTTAVMQELMLCLFVWVRIKFSEVKDYFTVGRLRCAFCKIVFTAEFTLSLLKALFIVMEYFNFKLQILRLMGLVFQVRN